MTHSAFEKRVRRRVTGPVHRFFAVCPPGLEKVCLKEISASGAACENIRLIRGGIEFDSKFSQAVELNLKLAAPSRILMRVDRSRADNFGQLEKKLARIDWELFLPKNCPLEFKVSTRKSRLYHSDAVAERAAVVLSDHLGKQGIFDAPGSALHEQTVFIRGDRDRFTVSLDTTGALLFKRGIKKSVTPAPLRENLAFAMLTWTGFSKDDILMDPMCGSGTFSLEAAMIQAGLWPGIFRSFAFESWPAFSEKTLSYLKKKAWDGVNPIPENRIFASDMDDDAISAVKRNIAGHDFARAISVEKKDFFAVDPTISTSSKGVIMLNPPYGKRMGKDGFVPDLFFKIAEKLKSDFKGWRIGILLPNRDCAAALGLPLDFKPVFHGGLNLLAGIGRI